MKVHTGIKNINELKEENRRGWHIIIDGQYSGYSDYHLMDILSQSSDNTILVDCIRLGNTLHVMTFEVE